jgi:putative transcriptional regulator
MDAVERREMTDWLTGRLLIAAPSMGDRRLRRAVILVCDHDHEHAMGIVLNKAMPKLTLPTLLDQIGIECSIEVPKTPVLDGGPCQRDRGFVLHSDDWESDDATLDVARGLRMTATRDVLQAIGRGDRPSKAMLALGYSGWGPGQLEDEIRANAWLIGDPDPRLVLEPGNLKGKWDAAFAELGIAPWRLSGDIGHA